VVSDVPVDDDVSVVTSRISRSADAQSFGGALGVGLRMCIHRGEYVCVL
jgi:hypothetical protein